MSRSKRERALKRAAGLQADGQYYQAIRTLREAGFTRPEVDYFLRTAQRIARARTVRLLTRYAD